MKMVLPAGRRPVQDANTNKEQLKFETGGDFERGREPPTGDRAACNFRARERFLPFQNQNMRIVAGVVRCFIEATFKHS